jgi:hypothetical protein
MPAALHVIVPYSPMIQDARNSHKGRTEPPGSRHVKLGETLRVLN